MSQNLVVLMKPSEEAYDHSLKVGNMILNRFCIDEDAAFELSGVHYLKKRPFSMDRMVRREKGKDNSFSQSFVILKNVIFMND